MRRWLFCIGVLAVIGCPAIKVYAGMASSYTLVVPITTQTWAQLNSLDSHHWTAEPWGGETMLAWSVWHERQSVRAAYTSFGGTEAYIRTDFFSPEDWSGHNALKIDVYVENGKSDMGLRIEVKNLDGVTIASSAVDPGGIPAGGWTTLNLSLTSAVNNVCQVFLIPTNLASGDSACFSWLTLAGPFDTLWDSFESASCVWRGAQDFRFWKTTGARNEPISHNRSQNGACSLYLPWSSSMDGVAKLEAVDLHRNNFVGVYTWRAQVFSSRTDAPIYLAFWDGSHWLQTDPKTVSAANTWTPLEWSRPTGDFDWANPVSFMFMVQTGAGGTGDIYLDSLEFLP